MTEPRQSWATKDGLFTLSAARPWGPEELVDRMQIQEAFARWGMAYDEGRLDLVESIFTEDGVYEVTQGKAEPMRTQAGAAKIAERVGLGLAFQGDQRRHAISNVVIDHIQGDAALAFAYGVVTVAADGLILGATVIYRGELKKGADGLWRFSRFVIGMDHYEGVSPATRDLPKS